MSIGLHIHELARKPILGFHTPKSIDILNFRKASWLRLQRDLRIIWRGLLQMNLKLAIGFLVPIVKIHSCYWYTATLLIILKYISWNPLIGSLWTKADIQTIIWFITPFQLTLCCRNVFNHHVHPKFIIALSETYLQSDYDVQILKFKKN